MSTPYDLDNVLLAAASAQKKRFIVTLIFIETVLKNIIINIFQTVGFLKEVHLAEKILFHIPTSSCFHLYVLPLINL